jgi:hypothetical protein
MEIEANRSGGGPSPFSRPPQPKPVQMTHASSAPTPTVRVAGSSLTAEQRKALEAQRRSGGQWFYWVAGLSVINIVLALTGQDWRFILGLGVTQLVQELAQFADGGTKAGLIGLAVIGLFAVLGHRAIHGHQWAFLLGMVLYALDGVIFFLIQDWAGVGFHAFALVMISRGYVAARQLPPPNA